MLEKALCSAEEPGLYRHVEVFEFHNEAAGYPEDYCSALTANTAEQHEYTDAEYLYDANGNCEASAARHLQVEEGDYDLGQMSQSASTVTIVANPNFKGKAEDQQERTSLKEEEEEQEVTADLEDDGCYLNVDGATQGNIKHQDSADSGMLSDNGSVSETTPPNLTVLFEAMGHDTRTLRHSLSWPETIHRRRGNVRFSDVDALGAESAAMLEEEPDIPRPVCMHHSSTREFNFHLPLNTRMTTSAAFEDGELPQISVEAINTPSSSNSGGPFQRIFFTSESHDDIENNSQVSFFTDTLNEVFVTDTSFHGGFSGSSKVGKCSKCGKIKSSKGKNINEKPLENVTNRDNEDVENDEKSNMRTGSREMESLEQSWEEKANKENLEKDMKVQNSDSCDCAREVDSSKRIEEGEPSPHIEGCDHVLHKAHTPCDCTTSDGCDPTNDPADCDTVLPSSNCLCDSSATQQTSEQSTALCDCPRKLVIPQSQSGSSKTNDSATTLKDIVHKDSLEVPKLQRVKYMESGQWPTFSPSHSVASVECDWDRER